MKSLFEKPSYDEIILKFSKLTPQSQRQWGKMDAAQMMAHCKEAFRVPIGETKLKRSFIGLCCRS